MTRTSRVLAGVLCGLALGSAAADYKEERQSRAYQSAMADYTAGRLDAALAGFEKAVRADGDNASARFQLACLQQDSRRDYLGAMCSYREYLRLEPGSDKAPLARERMALCERELARELAEKHGLGGNVEALREAERLRAELAAAEKSAAAAARDLKEAQRRVAVLERENTRLRRQVRTVGEEPAAAGKAAYALLDEEDDAAPPRRVGLAGTEEPDGSDAPHRMEVAPEAAAEDAADAAADGPRRIVKPVVEEDDGATGLRRGLAAARALVEEDDAGPELLETGERTPAERKLTDLAAAGARGGAAETQEGREKAEDAYRPKTYVVQEGDSLYRIARRFYGRESAWKRIRDANKATITTDGRVNAGQTIVLP